MKRRLLPGRKPRMARPRAPARAPVARAVWLAAGMAASLAAVGAARSEQASRPSLAQRLDRVSAARLGTLYQADPLGEGPGGTVDRDPLMTWSGVDCVTYVEQCLAEALVRPGEDAAALLQRIRYRNGVVSFETRNHFMLADWLPNNRWFAADVTARVGGSDCRTIQKTI